MQKNDPKYLERWANVYSLCRTIPHDSRFNMDIWGKQANTACGTAACAAGHAALHPWFRRRGLGARAEYSGLHPNDISGMFITFRSRRQWAIEKFFGCSNKDHTPFISCIGEDNPKVVAAEIRRYMRRTWSKRQVQNAINNAEAFYDAEYVHRFSPWRKSV